MYTTMFNATIEDVEVAVIEETIKNIYDIPFFQEALDKEIIVAKENSYDDLPSNYKIDISLVFRHQQLAGMCQIIQKLEAETPIDLIDDYSVTSNITL